jgi:hypothetical protein
MSDENKLTEEEESGFGDLLGNLGDEAAGDQSVEVAEKSEAEVRNLKLTLISIYVEIISLQFSQCKNSQFILISFVL